MNQTKVYIDPSIRILYASFYIKGLYEVFGERNVKFSTKYFKELKRKTEPYSFDQYMAFVIESKSEIKKFVIDFGDSRGVKESAYEWCDKYAKINFSETQTDKKFHAKMVSIPPSFGIRVWSLFETGYYFVSNYVKCIQSSSNLVSFKRSFGDYGSQHLRPKIEEYTTDKIKNKDKTYVFLIASLWLDPNCIDATNLQRKIFVETCKSLNLNFEGGFFSNSYHPHNEEFKEIIFTKRYSYKSYVEKTKKSAFVFNTPAVHFCHGWKLGEYLAMGKAIISTTLSNNLPEDLVPGENIHFISNSKELKDAILKMVSDDSYRKKLENGAKEYYSKFASPKAVIGNLICLKF